MVDTLLKLSGIFSEIFVVSFVFYCKKRAKNFSLTNNAFSYLGMDNSTERFFNISLFFLMLVRMLFISKILTFFNLWPNLLLIVSFFTSLVALGVVSLVPFNKNKVLHNISAYTISVFTIIFVLALVLAFWSINLSLAVSNIVVALFMIAIVFKFLTSKKTLAFDQMLFFVSIVIWDWLMTWHML
jgi:hypothetical protein